MLTRSLLTVFLILYLTTPTSPSDSSSHDATSYFPLSPGNYWIFKGSVKWTEGFDKTKEKEIEWKMEVVDKFDYDHYKIYLMKVHPGDLVSYKPGKEPSKYGYLVAGNKIFEIIDEKRMEELIDSKGQGRYDIISEHLLVFDFPLFKEKRFGATGQLLRPGGNYQWVVKDVIEKEYGGEKVEEYQLTYRTLADHQEVGVIEGVGITYYRYVHHGTVSEVDVKLVDYGVETPN